MRISRAAIRVWAWSSLAISLTACKRFFDASSKLLDACRARHLCFLSFSLEKFGLARAKPAIRRASNQVLSRCDQVMRKIFCEVRLPRTVTGQLSLHSMPGRYEPLDHTWEHLKAQRI